ncbi:MAG: hypothetical protein QM606_02365 [Leucobacter sp.]
MSKDPLEELFGPIAEDPQPVPARRRLQQEQAERIRTAQLPAERPAPKPQRPRKPRDGDGPGAAAKPWIVVGIIAVLAIVASIIVVNIARGAQDDAGSDAASQQTEQSSQTTEPTTPAASEETQTPDEGSDAGSEEVPEVEVGETLPPLDISQWDVSAVLSAKFGLTSYTLENGNTELWLDSPLIQQFPCDGHWGAVKTDAGKYEVLKPAERCAAAPELYDELWGLTDAFVKSIE